jgi:hypothetical protein
LNKLFTFKALAASEEIANSVRAIGPVVAIAVGSTGVVGGGFLSVRHYIFAFTLELQAFSHRKSFIGNPVQ